MWFRSETNTICERSARRLQVAVHKVQGAQSGRWPPYDSNMMPTSLCFCLFLNTGSSNTANAHRLQVAVQDVQGVKVADCRHNLRAVQLRLAFVKDARPARASNVHKRCTWPTVPAFALETKNDKWVAAVTKPQPTATLWRVINHKQVVRPHLCRYSAS